MIGKIIAVAVCFSVIGLQAGAQELGIELDGGLQGMYYPLQNGKSKALPGGSLGLDYTFRLGGQWGILTGIGGGLYRTQATFRDGLVFTSDQVDEAGSAFEYRMRATGYKEIQHFFAASIPLLLQFHTAGAGMQWYVEGGGRLFMPLGTGVDVSAGQLSVSGYYPDLNLEVSNLPQHGFGTIHEWKSSADEQLKPTAALSGATGISFAVGRGMRLYVGVYGDYGLTELKNKNGSMPLATYSPDGVNGVKAAGVLNMRNAGEAKLFAGGVQVRLSFGSRHSRRVDTVVKKRKGHAATRPVAPAKTQPAAAPVIRQPVTTPRTAPGKTEPVTQQPVTTPRTTPGKTEPVKAPTMAPAGISDHDIEILQTPVVFGLVGETAVPELQKQHLDRVVDILKRYPDIRIGIVGHICNGESETETAKMAAARANAVARYLQDKGISRKRMDVSSKKESDPVQPSDPSANYFNRRAEIMVR